MTSPQDEATLTSAELRAALERPANEKPQQRPSSHPVESFFGSTQKVNDAAIATLTLGELVYRAVSIQPDVLAGVDFARRAEIDDVFRFAEFADANVERTGAALTGTLSNLQGYVAEQFLANELRADGHLVEIAPDSNTAGYDLIVDGERFQVKCTADIVEVTKHLERFPDIPVFVNSELSDAVKELPAELQERIYFADGFERDVVQSMLSDSLRAGDELLDNDIPFFALAVHAARASVDLVKGRQGFAGAALEVTARVSSRAALSVVGHGVGKLVGAVVVGPAGAVIGGPLVGVALMSQSERALRFLRRAISPAQSAEVHACCISLLLATRRVVGSKLDLLSSRRAEARANLRNPVVREYVTARFDDEIAHLRQIANELEHELAHPSLDVIELAARALGLRLRSTVHPGAVQGEINSLLRALAAFESRLSRFLGRSEETR